MTKYLQLKGQNRWLNIEQPIPQPIKRDVVEWGSMRIDDTRGAVDDNGESWEAQDFLFCDANVLPTAVGVNPVITIQATACCLLNKIAEINLCLDSVDLFVCNT